MRRIGWLSPLVLYLLILHSAWAAEIAINGDDFRPGVVQAAYGFLHTPYLYGGSEAAGMDCSGLVCKVFFDTVGTALPRRVESLFQSGEKVGSGLRPGDLVFFNTTGQGPSHVGIYIGNQRFIHSASEGPATGVIISSLSEKYYGERWLGARRVIENDFPILSLRLAAEPRSLAMESRFVPGCPVQILLNSNLPRKQFVTISFKRADREEMVKRVRLLPGETTPPLWFTPREGRWQIEVKDQEGGLRGCVSFTAGEN